MSEIINKLAITEEQAVNIEETIRNKMFEAEIVNNRCYVDIALKVTEAWEQKVHVLRGYEDSMKGAENYLKETFGIKNTQRKSYAIVAHTFARRVEGGSEYQLIDDRLRDFGVANLEEIQKIDGFVNDSRDSLMKFLEDNKINDKTTKKEIMAIRGIEEKPKKTDDKKTDDKKTDDKKVEGQEPTGEDNITTTLKAENDKLKVTVEDSRTLISKLYQLALDEKTNDKKFREEAKKILKELEKKYK